MLLFVNICVIEIFKNFNCEITNCKSLFSVFFYKLCGILFIFSDLRVLLGFESSP